MQFARWYYTAGRITCDECRDDLEYGEVPECVDPEYQGEPCPLIEMELWPLNFPAWEAYAAVGDIVQPAQQQMDFVSAGGVTKAVTQPGLQPPPLDLAGVLPSLDWLGLSPPDADGREELLRSLQIIHRARQEANAQHQREMNSLSNG